MVYENALIKYKDKNYRVLVGGKDYIYIEDDYFGLKKVAHGNYEVIEDFKALYLAEKIKADQLEKRWDNLKEKVAELRNEIAWEGMDQDTALDILLYNIERSETKITF